MPPATEIERIHRAGRNLDRALTAVTVGALAFSTANVALLAIDNGVPAWIAWLLEPLVGIALWAVLSSDAVLSRYGESAGAWGWALRAFTGSVTLTLNIWNSVFTTLADGRLVFDPDPTGILLHSIAPTLLILLAEAAPRYRARFAAITARLHADDDPSPTQPGHLHSPHNIRSAPTHSRPETTPSAVGDEESHDHILDGEASGARYRHDATADPRPDLDATLSPAVGPDPKATHPSSSTPLPPDPEPRSGPDRRRPSKKRTRRERRARNDARARAILLLEPDITGAEMARRLGVETRSGQRILQRVTPPAGEGER